MCSLLVIDPSVAAGRRPLAVVTAWLYFSHYLLHVIIVLLHNSWLRNLCVSVRGDAKLAANIKILPA